MIEKLTEEYLKDSLITAYFINNERTRIEVISLDEDKKSQIATVIPYDTENDQCQALLKHMTLDMLHETTYLKLQNERKNFEELALQLAKKEGLIVETNKADSKFFNMMIDSIFNYKEDDKESMFALKIALFELDFIKDSKDKEKKAAIRKAQTPIDVLQVAFSMK